MVRKQFAVVTCAWKFRSPLLDAARTVPCGTAVSLLCGPLMFSSDVYGIEENIWILYTILLHVIDFNCVRLGGGSWMSADLRGCLLRCATPICTQGTLPTQVTATQMELQRTPTNISASHLRTMTRLRRPSRGSYQEGSYQEGSYQEGSWEEGSYQEDWKAVRRQRGGATADSCGMRRWLGTACLPLWQMFSHSMSSIIAPRLALCAAH